MDSAAVVPFAVSNQHCVGGRGHNGELLLSDKRLGGRTHTLDAPLIDGVVFAIGLQVHEAKSWAGQSKSTPMHSLPRVSSKVRLATFV